MKDMDREKLCDRAKNELFAIMEKKEISPSALDNASKLMDMIKDIKNMEYWDTKREYYMAVLDEMQGGYSERRDSRGRYSRADSMEHPYDRDSSYRGRRNGEHYVRGHYGRDDGYSGDHYDRYIDSKQSYRANGSQECKQLLMNTLEDYMDDFAQKMNEMLRDSDCAEERETIHRYLDKIKSIA